ncbi:bifunctional phosphoribosyl-AMP cyclohydrolase/phosphoribosyl-ATP diphosphatase HisIE [Planococcus lenghuensis]|uniref:Histidine biosynthesis bifunctional protein HisIE n=1 Tax=Planococcus lenghuensis TaxID=2213202 RepID=A0A1Q2L261_9BACL|nr:bifunctional phosphoribosyl-AMP cyclohydrolase/phosphoribosyl-ATP diphosphatase HisIE [Planococcus lenghuensis]AQQ54503.1 bifunctional phosphoribosyl-AMP cyclohydrolase/phosphoribosyl-ATP diphosphatase [Planococcus lenghuensis]
MKPDFSKGLLPVVLQHWTKRTVLMLGYMNEEAFEKTQQDGVVWFFSRSKDRLWKKGESSGNVQHVKSMALDCDDDTLLVQVEPAGPTCHLGTESCFGEVTPEPLQGLETTVANRAKAEDESSYTRYLLKAGIDKIIKKFGEESFEVAIAAKNRDRGEVVNETADLLYHLTVLLHEQGVSLREVEDVLHARHAVKNNFKGERKDIDKW